VDDKVHHTISVVPEAVGQQEDRFVRFSQLLQEGHQAGVVRDESLCGLGLGLSPKFCEHYLENL
jgi:hypothetical protein